jgi:hypothetical protein
MPAAHESVDGGGHSTPSNAAPKQENARGKARGMVLRWALLKAMGPDRWHFAAILNEERYQSFRAALQRALDKREGQASVIDFGAGPALLSCAAEQLGAGPVTR